MTERLAALERGLRQEREAFKKKREDFEAERETWVKEREAWVIEKEKLHQDHLKAIKKNVKVTEETMREACLNEMKRTRCQMQREFDECHVALKQQLSKTEEALKQCERTKLKAQKEISQVREQCDAALNQCAELEAKIRHYQVWGDECEAALNSSTSRVWGLNENELLPEDLSTSRVWGLNENDFFPEDLSTSRVYELLSEDLLRSINK